MTKLLGLQYRLRYKKGVENLATDALSRKCSLNDGELLAVSTSVPAWLADIATGYKADVHSSRILAELSMGNTKHRKFTLKDGILRYDGRIWVGTNATVQQQILQSMHSSAVGGHSGVQVTYCKTRKLLEIARFANKRRLNMSSTPDCCSPFQFRIEHGT